MSTVTDTKDTRAVTHLTITYKSDGYVRETKHFADAGNVSSTIAARRELVRLMKAMNWKRYGDGTSGTLQVGESEFAPTVASYRIETYAG